jgi:hypothetical protein
VILGMTARGWLFSAKGLSPSAAGLPMPFA